MKKCKIFQYFSLKKKFRELLFKIDKRAFTLGWYEKRIQEAAEELERVLERKRRARIDLIIVKSQIAKLWHVAEKDTAKFYQWLEGRMK